MSPARLHTTTAYHTAPEAPSLGWEQTICESLATRQAPCQAALVDPAPYGGLLARFLADRLGLDPDWSVVEVGGGTGSLMAAFLGVVPVADLTLVDLSPAFTARQRRALAAHSSCRFVTEDALAYLERLDREVDLVVSNENIGDFPQVTGVERRELLRALAAGGAPGPLGEVAEVVARYRLDLEDAPETFAFNLGPVRYLERLRPVAKAVFLSEHGCDTVVPAPWQDFLVPTPGDGFPRRIPLKGHDEYTIRFGHLERVAQALGYRVHRFHMAELVGLRDDPGIRFMARTGVTLSETAEAVCEFCAHVADYQCMLLTRDS